MKAPLTITARDMGLKIGAGLPKAEDYKFDTAGLLEGDTLITNPTLSCNITDTAATGEYDITVAGADAGMNYDITYKNGTLTVSETGESAAYYTVTFNMSGHGSDITNTGIKEGSLLEKPQDPQVEGYTFTGWYKDQSCTSKWDFATDTVQSDMTLYAGWNANDNDQNDDDKDDNNNDNDNDKDDSAYTDAERKELSSVNAAIGKIKSKVYDGNAYEPVIKVTAKVDGKNTTLTEGIDYRALYNNNINAGTGTATVTVKGNGIYKGSITQSYTISAKPVSKLKIITGGITSTIQTNDLSALPVCVYDGAKRLTYGTDYELTNYSVVKSTASVTMTGKNNYTGTKTVKLTIYNSDKIINPENVEAIQPQSYNAGKVVIVEPQVTVGDVALIKNKDYKVQYQNNKNAGTAYVIVTGKGAYKGKVVVPFTIQAADVSSDGVTVKPISPKTYNGKLQKPAVTVTVNVGGKNKKITKNKDYTVTYKNNLHAGTAKVIITGKGNYAGIKKEVNFTIKQQQIKKASVKGTQGSLTLIYSKHALKEGTDYEVSKYGEVNKNKVKVTITGKHDFTGEITKSVKVQ
ncbi:MAG: InlB B-repeat-containing protein [Lachnospiraceae bacterium]|nr:InlB B-repeat-containing protein [Lachnospiraceae bacterium]